MFNYDNWKLMSPEDEIHARAEYVCDCEHCGEPLFAGHDVVIDNDDKVYFCDKDCYDEHYEDRYDYVTLESKYDRWDD